MTKIDEELSAPIHWSPATILVVEVAALCFGIAAVCFGAMMIVPMSILGIGPAVKESHLQLWNHLIAAGLFLTCIAAASIPITCLVAIILRRTSDH